MIGIIGAMAVEVEELLGVMREDTLETFSGIDYHRGTIAGAECVVARCGVGKVAAAVCAQTMILKYGPSSVFNIGVAGGIGNNVHIGDVVISSGLVQHDMDTSALGDEKGFLSGINLVTIPASGKLAKLAFSAAKGLYGEAKTHTGIIASGDQFISDPERLERISEEFGALACEMEGASIAQVCFLNQIDFLVLRSISDNADEEAAVDFTQFAKESAHLLTKLICAVLPEI